MTVPHWSRLVDTALDRAVVPGYSRVGPRLRRHWWPADPEPGSLDGEHVVVTGASGGLGAATAEGLASLGATVHLVGRNPDRLERAAAAILAGQTDAQLVTQVCDVSNLDAVRDYADNLRSQVDAVHSVVHNAGVMPPRRTESAQGHELALATHVLGPLLLTELLRPALRAAAGSGRVVWVSSGGMYAHPFTADVAADLEYTAEAYNGTTAYEIWRCDWSSDVCSSDLPAGRDPHDASRTGGGTQRRAKQLGPLLLTEIGRASCRERV